MYISSYLTLDTALSGVEAAQEELDTTGENITNVDTDDYEEQTVNLVESPALSIAGAGDDGAMQLGTGVDAISVTNSGDPYLDAAWRTQNAATTAATTTQSYLQQIDAALNEPSTTGINAQLSQFWSDWNTLAANPTGTAGVAAQQAVIQDGETLATSLNELSSALNGPDPNNPTDATNAPSILGQVNTQYQDVMSGPTGAGASGGSVYNDAYQISSLNYAIVQAQAAGQSPNDLIDQRNAAIDNLSSLGNVTVDNNADGSVTVYFGGVSGTALVKDPAGIPPGGTVPPGDNFGSYATASGGAGSGWVQAFQDQYADAATDSDTFTTEVGYTPSGGQGSGGGQSAAQLANTVGGTLGSLIGLAGYSGTGFGDLGQPVQTTATAATTYPSSTAAGAAATQLGTIGALSAQLDSVAVNLMNEVNNPAVVTNGEAAVQTSTGEAPVSDGVSPNATTQVTTGDPPVVTGGSPAISLLSDFFVLNPSSSSGGAAATIAVASSLQTAAANGITPDTFSSSSSYPTANTGVNNVQLSTLGTTYAGNYSSDNDVALDEANNSAAAADLSYDSFVEAVGSLAQGANDAETTQSALQTQVTNQRQSVEGVDLSQEMSNLISEQQSYQASAKVMNAFSTVMDSLMSVVGQS